MIFKPSFKKFYYSLCEKIREKLFKINISGNEFIIHRDQHVIDSRGNTKRSRDEYMSKNKYKIVLEAGIEHIDKNKPFTITWTTNNKNFAISGKFQGNSRILIFGAIMRSKTPPEKLYAKKGTNRYHLGQITF